MKRRRLSDILRRDLDADPWIEGVTADSRKVKRGYLFAALPGLKADGRAFAEAAAA
ncbi:MAG: Mur ligase domain-containing protein, partial [Caulobacteraceae bacterium]